MSNVIAVLLALCQLISLITGTGAVTVFDRDNGSSASLAVSQRCAYRAELLAESYYNNTYYSIPEVLTLCVGGGTAATCWEYGGAISLSYKLALLDKSELTRTDELIASLDYYRHEDENGNFAGYAVARAHGKGYAGDGVAYDDNMWICRDLAALYELSGDGRYLDKAVEIADFLISNAFTELDPEIFRAYGIEVAPGTPLGGFYWDSRHDALHTCSNGPAAQCLAALYRITGNALYLEYAEKSYNFLKTLINPDGVFYDLMAFTKDGDNAITGIMGRSEEYYSYNSGSPVTAAVELYRATGNTAYLSDASVMAADAQRYFVRESAIDGVKAYPSGNVWFNLILLNGFIALAPYDSACEEYIADMLDAIDYAYTYNRAERKEAFGGTFLPRDWINGFSENAGDDYNALVASANAEIYATLALYYGA